MFANGHVPIIQLSSSYMAHWVKRAVGQNILEAMQCGFKIVHGNNPKLHLGKRFDGTKTDAVLIVSMKLSKKHRHWTHQTIWAVRDMPPQERMIRLLKGQVEIGFYSFPDHYAYLSKLGCKPEPTDEVVYSKRLGIPKPKKAEFPTSFDEDWLKWDGNWHGDWLSWA